MKYVCAICATLALFLWLTPGGVAAKETRRPPTQSNAFFDDARILFNVRTRYSYADFESFERDAHGVTFRLRAGFESGALFDTTITAELDFVRGIHQDFNSTLNGKTVFPVVADPDIAELNRFFLANKSLPETTLLLGRQRIAHGDHRFVGNVGWRQNEQTYDAVRLVNKSIPAVTIDVSYVDQVNRIFGRRSAQGRFASESYLVRADYEKQIGAWNIKSSAFAYLLDFENPATVAALRNSTQTYGGNLGIVRGPMTLSGSFANQTAYGENNNPIDLNYYKAEGGVRWGNFTVKTGVETLGGDGANGFSTPLATLHKFNGFADVFLVTPSNGLQDIYTHIGYQKMNVGPIAMIRAEARYHHFSADESDEKYGDEFDVLLVGRLKRMNRVKYVVKYANFRSTGFGEDVERLTFQVEFQY